MSYVITLNPQVSMPEHLTEHVSDWRQEIVVEQAARTIRNVALAGPESKNGYRYSERSLKDAAALYENVPVFLDHPASPQRPRDRSARDLAGSVTNARYEGGRLRGDLKTLDTEAGRTLLALATSDGPGVGMSHVVLAERSRDGATVERIVEVISVDAVAFPATTRTFRESTCGTAAIERVKHRMAESKTQQADDPASTVPRDPTEGSSLRVRVASSARASRLLRTGSLERLLAAIDAELPGHLRRLAAATESIPKGRGVRVGVFPKHVVVEWRAVGSSPEHFALTWQIADGGLVFGDQLLKLEQLTTEFDNWNAFLTREQEHNSAHHQIEQLTERLEQIAAERDRLAARLTSTPITSSLRRPTHADRVPDDLFIRTIRRH